MEVVIAITLTAMVVTIMYSAMSIGYKSREKGVAQDRISQKLRIVSDRITWLLRGAYGYTLKNDLDNYLFFQGESDNLGFVTTSVDSYESATADVAGLKWVRIFVDREGLKFKEGIYFSEKNLEKDEEKEFLFDRDVKDIKFEYFEIEKDSSQGEWKGDWDYKSKTSLPVAVRFKVTFEIDGNKFEMPPITARLQSVYGRNAGL